MSKKIFEEKGGPHRGHAAGDTDVEKQASQLASDVKYKVKQSMSGSTNLSPAQVTRAYVAQLSKSPAPPSVKALAKKKLMGSSEPSGPKNEDYTEIDLSQIIEQSVVSALTRVFVEHETVKVHEVENEYLNSLLENEDRKYKVRVTDKKTGNSYIRHATRAKIAELRSNPNISSVEMTEYGEPIKSEKNKGEQTSKTKSGKGLDPVGKEDKDIDNDGDHDKSDKYLLNRRKTRGAAIASRGSGETQKEEFLGEVKKKEDENKIKESGVNNYKDGTIKMFPEIKESSYQRFLKVIQEKAVSQNQQQLAGMALAYLRGDMPDASEEVKKMAKMGEKKLRDFAKTKHEGLPEKVKEEADCGCDDKKTEKEIDPRQLKTMKDRTRTSLGLMGIKASYEPEGEQIDELGPLAGLALRAGLAGAAALGGKALIDKASGAADKLKKTQSKKADQLNQLQSYEPEGEMVDEARAEEKRGLGSTGAQRQKQKKGVVTSSGQVAHPATSYSGGQNPHLRGKGGGTKEQRRAASRRYVDQPGGAYAAPENQQGKGRYAKMLAKKRDQSHMSSRFD